MIHEKARSDEVVVAVPGRGRELGGRNCGEVRYTTNSQPLGGAVPLDGKNGGL